MAHRELEGIGAVFWKGHFVLQPSSDSLDSFVGELFSVNSTLGRTGSCRSQFFVPFSFSPVSFSLQPVLSAARNSICLLLYIPYSTRSIPAIFPAPPKALAASSRSVPNIRLAISWKRKHSGGGSGALPPNSDTA